MILLVFVIILGMVAQLSLIFPSGIFYRGKYEFFGAQSHDGLWHISLAQKMSHLSFENPIFSGERIRNYHYFSNLIVAFLHRISGLSVFTIFFVILPIAISALLGLEMFLLVKEIFRDELSALWSVFFVYLGSNFAYFLPIFGLGNEILETSFWVQQPISVFSNFPFSMSLPIVFAATYFLARYLRGGGKKYLVFSVILFSLAVPTKSFSVVFILGMGMCGTVRLIFKKRGDILLASIASAFLAFLWILPSISFGKHLIFEPGFFLRTMIEAGDRMNWQEWALKLQYYTVNSDTLNLIKFYGTAFVIFIVGNLGTRLLMFIGIPRFRNALKDEIHLFLLSSLVVSALIPMFFLTTGIAWNSIQFMYYFLLIAGIYSGHGTRLVVGYFKKPWIKIFVSVVIILLTIPTNLYTLRFRFSHNSNLTVAGEELKALVSLKEVGSYTDRILTLPAEASFVEVSAFTGKSVYLGDWLMAVVTGHDYDKRLLELKTSMSSREAFLEFLERNNIRWIYIKGYEPEIIRSIAENLALFYSSSTITIYHVEKI
jgi:hypothetical protein